MTVLCGWRPAGTLKTLVFAVSLLGSATFAEESAHPEILKNVVIVESLNSSGRTLKTGAGFLYDEETVVCSYSLVKGAWMIQVRVDGARNFTNRLISYSTLFDLAVLKAEEEIPEPASLGSSDMVGVGDPVFYVNRKRPSWEVMNASVQSFQDAGKGYEMMRLSGVGEGTVREPSPLFNGTGQVIGWLRSESEAVPLETISDLVAGRSSSITLAEINRTSDAWKFLRLSSSGSGLIPATDDLRSVQGTNQFPFRIELPQSWQQEKLVQPGRFLLRAVSERSGVSVELRVVRQETDELISSIEKAETLIFSPMTRSVFIPFSTDYFTGFQANYEDPDPAGESTVRVHYTAGNGYMYILSFFYSRKQDAEITPLVEKIVASLQL